MLNLHVFEVVEVLEVFEVFEVAMSEMLKIVTKGEFGGTFGSKKKLLMQ